ncbi:unnamed protein product [Haemonchus placei]|uniref:Uncharacterized protein n=1 Tax=Haemonchus placei TaxID=6290 RepID=A0A158QQL2_HAEPC|nr:unnamed protein product [Haemonchus placei]
MPVFSPPKKRSRRDSEEDSSRFDGSGDYEDEHDDYDDGEELVHSKEDLISPHEMNFRKFVEERGKLSVSWSRMRGLFDDWMRQQTSNVVDSDILLKSFKRYLSSSLKPTNMSLDSCFRNVREYLDRPDSVLLHKDFPTKPPSLLQYYCKKFGHTAGFGKYKELADRMRDDHAGRTECEQELLELEMFPVPRTPKAKVNKANGIPKEEKTAFDLFCSTKQDKYTDLPPEKRLKKLKKKFDKLPDDKREIFEKLALVR